MHKLALLFCSMLISNAAYSQIPNPGFEIWDSSAGYKVPVGWDNMNPSTTSSGIHTCERMPFAYAGNYSLALNTQNIPGMGIVPAIAVSGKLDQVTYQPIYGFPYTLRPQVLAGTWQYMPYTTADQPYVSALLSKWNSTTSARDTVAYAYYAMPGMEMFWTQFHIVFNYVSTATPDSAMIVLSASGPNPIAYSFLNVDDLRLTDSTTLLAPIVHRHAGISVIPNPAYENTSITYTSVKNSTATVSITDMTGRIVMKTLHNVQTGENRIIINTAQLAPGVYIAEIEDDTEAIREKLIVR